MTDNPTEWSTTVYNLQQQLQILGERIGTDIASLRRDMDLLRRNVDTHIDGQNAVIEKAYYDGKKIEAAYILYQKNLDTLENTVPVIRQELVNRLEAVEMKIGGINAAKLYDVLTPRKAKKKSVKRVARTKRKR